MKFSANLNEFEEWRPIRTSVGDLDGVVALRRWGGWRTNVDGMLLLLLLLIIYTVEPLITVTSAQRPPPDLPSVKKVPAEFKVKLS